MITHGPSSETNAIQRLSSLAGISPSHEWLTLCRHHFRSQNETDDENAILNQILHADLRDVIRGTDIPSSLDNPPHREGGETLRTVIRDSLPSGGEDGDGPCMAVTPGSFRHLVQVEEFLDVSLNAEARYSYGPTSASNPTPTGNQRTRCLKMCLSDGYRFEDEGSPSLGIVIVGMETSPIPDLSVHSKAGMKVMLKGEITVRFGVLMLNEGNAVVLGGCVPVLMSVQKKALEMAKKMAGVGVDPTVKALIWNPHDGTEEEEDEGEQASADVVQPVPDSLHPIRNTAMIAVTQPDRTNPTLTNTSQPQVNQVNRTTLQATTQPQPNPPHATVNRNSHTPHSSSSNRNIPNSSRPPLHNPQTATNHPQPMEWSAPTTHSKLPKLKTLPNPTLPRNPYSNTTPRRTTTAAAPSPLSPEIQIVKTTPPPSSFPPRPMNTYGASNQPNILPQPSLNLSPTALTVPLSFREFKSLLHDQILTDPSTYRQYQNKIFVVPSKLRSQSQLLDFNIEKSRKKKKGTLGGTKGDKYAYTMTCYWEGTSQADGKMICKLSSDLLEPFFDLSPGDMRKLRRTKPEEAQRLASQGGNRVVVEFSSLASFHVRLFLTAEEYFEGKSTGGGGVGDDDIGKSKKPFLVVIGSDG